MTLQSVVYHLLLQELVYIVYNDQPPPGMSNSTSNGHTKGVVIFGARTGLWIVHSVPRFPDKLFTGKFVYICHIKLLHTLKLFYLTLISNITFVFVNVHSRT